MTPRLDFASDNLAPATPEAMAALVEANAGPAAPYGSDSVTAQAADLVRALLDADAEVRFMTSGTAANAVSLAMLCRPFEAVLAHEHAHVCTDEAGSPGFLGQGLGLIGLPGAAGRIDPGALARALESAEVSHRQSPAALSLTNATEYGAVYSPAALEALIAPARARGLGVHLDGARLANAVAAGFDPTSLARAGVDVLVIGGTKAGMPPADALVVFDKALAGRLDVRLKQAGQLPSKGRFQAAPFVGMLRDGAMFRHAAHANAMARKLAALSPFVVRHPVEANAVFMEIDDARLARLNDAGWVVHRFLDGSVRFMCAWTTTETAVEELAADLRAVA